MKNKFHKGDLVKYEYPSGRWTNEGLEVGGIYEVESEASPTMYFRWINLVGLHNTTSDGSYEEFMFSLVASATVKTYDPEQQPFTDDDI